VEFFDGDAVLGQCFRFRPAWWIPRIPQQWGGFLDELPDAGRNYRWITRADVLRPCADGLPQSLEAGYVWGTGPATFLVGRRARVFRDNDADRIDDCLQSAADKLHAGNTIDAYESMLPARPNNLKHLGPSFFTKFLYSADSDGWNAGKALILDQFVARALKNIDGWDIPCFGPWAPGIYEKWLNHAHGIAAAEKVRPDAVELAYFRHGRNR
jgi:hypothetical protein